MGRGERKFQGNKGTGDLAVQGTDSNNFIEITHSQHVLWLLHIKVIFNRAKTKPEQLEKIK